MGRPICLHRIVDMPMIKTSIPIMPIPWQRAPILVFAAVLLTLSLLGRGAAAAEPVHILAFNSWHQDMPWQVSYERGLRAGLEDAEATFHVYNEYLDAGRFPESSQHQNLSAFLKAKYASKHIDIIITESRPAANFFLDRPNLLPDAKRIYVQPGTPLKDQITVPVDIDFGGAIAEMVRLAAPQKVYVVADTLTESRAKRVQDFKAARAALNAGFEVEYLTDLPMDELLERVSQLPARSAIFYLLIFKDGNGQNFTPYQAAKLMAARANAPVFSHWETLIGSGILGGYLLSGERVGQIAASSVNALLKGRAIAPGSTRAFGHYYDWQQLKRWGIHPDQLPPDTSTRFYEPTLFEQHKLEVITTLSALILLTLLSIGLVVVNSKRQQAVSALEREHLLLAQRVDQRTARLQESEQKYRSIFEASKVGLALCKMDGTLVECNQAYLDLIGYTEAEALELTYWDLTPRSFEAEEARQLQSIEETGGYGPYEKHYIRKDGSQVPVMLNGTKLKGADGDDYIWSIIQDITERTLLDRSKTEFISTVSHELRTPLTSIKGSLSLLVGGVVSGLPEKAMDLVEIAHNNADQLITLVSDILDLEKLQSGRMEFHFEDIDLGELIAEGVKANHGYSQEYGVAFQLSDPLPEITVRADKIRITQVLTNLLSNAAKFSRKGEAVGVSISTYNGVAQVSVSDHGPGIAEEFRDRIFERFAQEDASDQRAKGGTGLGLSICKTIVEKHGGEVSFETESGAGSTFHFTMPISGPVPGPISK